MKAFQDSVDTLFVGDYEDCGYDIGNETGGRAHYTPIVEGSNRMDISSDILVGEYNVWHLNPEGLDWINKTGYTKLCMREGHDLFDHPYGGTANEKNFMYIYMSEEPSTDKDPYLEVTYVLDDDGCPDSDLSETVVIDSCDSGVNNVLLDDGCTISDLIWQCADYAGNHGDFLTSCVSHMTKDLKKDGTISGKEKGKIQRCAAKADIP